MKTLYLMMGISGSGKSYWARDFQSRFTDTIIISRDAIRFSLVKENEPYFSKEKKVFKTFVHLAKEAILTEINNIILDATHLNFSSRQKVLNSLKEFLLKYNYKVIIMHIDTDLQKASIRDSKRRGRERVGEEIIIRQLKAISPVDESEKKYWKEFFPMEYWNVLTEENY